MAKKEAYKPKRQYIPKEKRKLFNPAILVAVFFGFVMVTSTIGFIASYSDPSANGEVILVGDHEFVRTQRGFGIVIDDVPLEFTYLPDSVASIELDQAIVDTLKQSKSIIVTYEPESPINGSAGLVQYNLEQLYDKVLGGYVQRSVINNTDYPTLSSADCSDATEFIPVLKFEFGNLTHFSREGNCIIATSTHDFDTIRLHDRLSYRLLGVTTE